MIYVPRLLIIFSKGRESLDFHIKIIVSLSVNKYHL